MPLGRAVIRLILTFDRGELAILIPDDHPAAPAQAPQRVRRERARPAAGRDPGKVVWAVIQAG